MTILKLDPSLTHTGVVVIRDGKCIMHGTIAPDPKWLLPERLRYIARMIHDMDIDGPLDTVLIEVPHLGMRFGRGRAMLNARSVQLLNYATGVAIAAVSPYCADVQLIEARPLRINGRVVARKHKKRIITRLMSDKYGVELDEHCADAASLEPNRPAR